MNKMCPTCGATFGPEVVSCPRHPDERLMLVSTEQNFIGQTLDGKYRLIAKLGEGGMGSVYLGVQSQIEREVAVKILRSEFKVNPTAVKRFLREARAASKLSHPNSITVYDFGQAMSGDLYIVMERLTGCSLADVLDDVGQMPVERAVHILVQICDSLTEAHRIGITHRDLKPENIHIEQKAGNPDFVKVLDFGIAKMRADNEDTNKATQTGMICGTPSYMSPEQAMGRELDGRSDLYALGILLYEMLTNQRPFEGDAAMEVMLKHINEPPPDIFQRTGVRVPVGIQDLIEKLLAKDPARRPPNCEEVKRLLLQGLKTPLIGPIDSTNDNIPAKRLEQARSGGPEKTGLAPAAPAPTATDRAAVSGSGAKPQSSSLKTAFVMVGLLAVAAGGVIAFSTGMFSSETQPASTTEAANPVVETAAAASNTVVEPAEARPAADLAKAQGVVAAPTDPSGAPAAAAIEPPASDAADGKSGSAEAAASGSAHVDDVPANDADSAPEPIEMTDFIIASVPPGASVFEGDVLLGNTPISFSRRKNSDTVRLVLKMKGFVDKPVALGTVADRIEETYPLQSVGRRPGALNPAGRNNRFGTF